MAMAATRAARVAAAEAAAEAAGLVASMEAATEAARPGGVTVAAEAAWGADLAGGRATLATARVAAATAAMVAWVESAACLVGDERESRALAERSARQVQSAGRVALR